MVHAGVQRIHRPDLLRKRVHGGAAGQRHIVHLVIPELEHEEGLGFEIVREFVAQVFQGGDESGSPGIFVLLGIDVERRIGVDPELLVMPGFVAALHGFLHEVCGAFLVVDVRHGHAPVSDRAIGIQGGDLTEGTLRFKIPKAV